MEASPQLTGIGARLQEAGSRIADELSEIGVRYAAAVIPRRSGRLARSLRVSGRPGRREIVMGGASAPYAPYVEYGARPHVIRPRRAEALRFVVDGEVVYARRVHHPGTRPAEVMGRTAEYILSRVGEVSSRVLPRFTKIG